MRIATIIATRPRVERLINMSLPSVARQRRVPDIVLLVPDSSGLPEEDRRLCQETLAGIPLLVLPSVQGAGLAAALNSGLRELSRSGCADYVALLDDDDEWDCDHLEVCQSAALRCQPHADAVISGLRIVRGGVEISRQPLAAVRVEDFLVGNPGWQGSNTFAALDLFQRVGGFTSGLRSANDRDLAIRVLDSPGVRIEFTQRMTATWHIDSQPDAISRHGSEDKQLGLRKFHEMYGHRMTESQRKRAVERARQLFGVDPDADV